MPTDTRVQAKIMNNRGLDLFLVFNRQIGDDSIAGIVRLVQRHLDDAEQWFRDFRPVALH